MAPLHRMNPVRLAFLRDQLCAHFGRDRRTKPFARAAHARCRLRRGARMRAAGAVGRDGDRHRRAPRRSSRAARAHAEAMRLDIDYRRAAAEDLEEKFDAVIALEVVEHVADRELFLDRCGAWSRPAAR